MTTPMKVAKKVACACNEDAPNSQTPSQRVKKQLFQVPRLQLYDRIQQ